MALYTQKFIGGEFRLALSTGSYIREECLLSPQIAKRIKFIKPDYIPQHSQGNNRWFSDKRYYRAFQNAFKRAYNEDWFVRIRRSLNSFLSSYSNAYSVGYFDRIISLVTSIEIMLDTNASNSASFVQAIRSIIGFSNKDCRASRRMTITNRKIGAFLNSLYQIRSKYVHGEIMTDADVHHPRYGEYFRTGVIIYYELIRSLLEKNQFLKKRSLYRKLFEYEFNIVPDASE